jgi:hypothetical protein
MADGIRPAPVAITLAVWTTTAGPRAAQLRQQAGMDDWTQITYRDFWDVPRMVVARRGSEMFLFCSRLDELADTHADHYEVWAMPLLSENQLEGSWIGLEDLALRRLPNIGLQELPFVVPRRVQNT